MTTIWWVRHGPTHARTMVGWTDLPADLSDTGRLSRLEAFLPDAAVVVSSDLRRAVATADAIQGDRLRLPHLASLREIHFGAWENKTFAEVEAQDAALIRAYWDSPGDIRPPQGESWNDIALRVKAAVDDLIAQGHDHIIAVAHFGVILTQVQRALGLTAYKTLSHKIDNLSVTEIRFSTGRWDAGPINRLV
ncbi:histidine phosphatase family protein [Pseudogemmobacter sp. W21_MBD1_M6]|uniref:histidine phosphatase family protein n=1 Tax=Pseudogemmobacter sp. W21_MBD1_M6 TaxID=3240271 RepID=UPI003F96E3ED